MADSCRRPARPGQTRRTGVRPLQVSLIQTATYASLVALGIVAGTLADRLDRRLLLVVCQAWMALGATVLFVATWLGWTDPLVVLALTFGIGFGTAVAAPTWVAIQPSLVPPHLACTVPAVLAWKAPARPPHCTESFGQSFRAGLRCIATAPQRQILTRYALFILPAPAVMAMTPVLAGDRLGLAGAGFGVFLATFGAGAALAVIVWSRVEGRGEEWGGLVASTVVLAVALVTAAVSTQPVVVGAALLAAGIGFTLGSTCAFVAAQRVLDDTMRARVMAIYTITSGAVVAAASAGWGVVARLRFVQAFALAAAVAVISLLMRRRWPLPARTEDRTGPGQ
ncbi:MFS transporter [Streptomyces sp. NPDC018026]|uniref:MFS transporter n=1 Tax=Streptomyces sp. NPDC018026 TaxID=3365031 RepID=UPI0037B89A5F